MASQFDIAFFRIAIYNKVTDQATATRCLQYIDQQGQQGNALRAPEVLARVGNIESRVVQQLVTMTENALRQQGGSAPPAPPPTPAPAPPPAPPTTSGRQQRGPSGRQRGPSGRERRQSGRQRAASGPRQAPGGAPLNPDDVQVRDKIGAGPNGNSYAATDRASGRELVVKVLTRKFQKSPPVFQTVVGAARKAAAAQITHPDVGAPLAYYEKDGRQLLAFPKLAGAPLDGILKERGRLAPKLAVRLMQQVARGLARAHEKGLAHGDVRPARVFADLNANEARLTDFGLAQATALIQGYARAGVPFGHPCYLAPEVIQTQQREPSVKADIYALGVSLYELICGRRPFVGNEPRQVLESHLRNPLPKPPEEVYLHERLAELLLRMTAKVPDKRIGSAAEVADQLRALAELALDSSQGDDVDNAAWAHHSQEVAAPKEWSEDKVREASSAEPDEWDPDELEEDPDFEDIVASKRSARQRVSAPQDAKLAAALAEATAAADAGEATSTPKKDRKRGKSARGPALQLTGKKGGAGNRFELKGDELRAQRDRARKVNGIIAVSSLVVLTAVGVGYGFSTLQSPEEKSPTAQGPKATPPPPPQQVTKSEVKAAKQSREAQRNKALDAFSAKLNEALAAEDYPGAERLLNTFTGPYSRDPESFDRLNELRRQVESAAKAEVDKARARIEPLLIDPSAEKVAAAKVNLHKLDNELIAATRPLYRQLELAIEAAEAAAAAKVAIKPSEDAPKEPWQKDLRAALFAKELVFDGSRVEILYDFSTKEQARDFQLADTVAMVDAGADPGLLVTAKEVGVLGVFPVPALSIERIELSYKLLPNAKLKKTSEISIATGVDPSTRLKGLRFTNGGKMVEFFGRSLKDLKSIDVVTASDAVKARIDPWSEKPRAFEFVMSGMQQAVSLDGKSALTYRGEPRLGLVGFFVQDLKVQITRLRLIVTLDPKTAQAFARRRLK